MNHVLKGAYVFIPLRLFVAWFVGLFWSMPTIHNWTYFHETWWKDQVDQGTSSKCWCRSGSGDGSRDFSRELFMYFEWSIQFKGTVRHLWRHVFYWVPFLLVPSSLLLLSLHLLYRHCCKYCCFKNHVWKCLNKIVPQLLQCDGCINHLSLRVCVSMCVCVLERERWLCLLDL